MTKRGLNLGAGRAQLPVTEVNKQYSEHLNYALQFVPEATDASVEWVNVDRAAIDGIQEVINVFRYPWIKSSDSKPFEDNSFDVVWCSHIVEHIPHTINLGPLIQPSNHPIATLKEYDPYLIKLMHDDGDGWFAFMYECWRVLKPGGRLHIVAPYAFSDAGMSDPTHTRYITPGSFSYFVPNPSAPFDYQLPFRFDQVTVGEGGVIYKFQNQAIPYAQKAGELSDLMKAQPDSEYSKSEFDKLMGEFGQHITQHINQIQELYLCFSATK